MAPDIKTPDKNADAARRRRGRSWAILIVLFALCGLFYAITLVKLAKGG